MTKRYQSERGYALNEVSQGRTRKKIIGIFTIYWVRHWYCTFWLFVPKLPIVFTEVGPVKSKIDADPPLSITISHCLPSSSSMSSYPIHLNNRTPFFLTFQNGDISMLFFKSRQADSSTRNSILCPVYIVFCVLGRISQICNLTMKF